MILKPNLVNATWEIKKVPFVKTGPRVGGAVNQGKDNRGLFTNKVKS
jgi:hypothetical protein